jgi:hypothetical protein
MDTPDGDIKHDPIITTIMESLFLISQFILLSKTRSTMSTESPVSQTAPEHVTNSMIKIKESRLFAENVAFIDGTWIRKEHTFRVIGLSLHASPLKSI